MSLIFSSYTLSVVPAALTMQLDWLLPIHFALAFSLSPLPVPALLHLIKLLLQSAAFLMLIDVVFLPFIQLCLPVSCSFAVKSIAFSGRCLWTATLYSLNILVSTHILNWYHRKSSHWVRYLLVSPASPIPIAAIAANMTIFVYIRFGKGAGYQGQGLSREKVCRLYSLILLCLSSAIRLKKSICSFLSYSASSGSRSTGRIAGGGRTSLEICLYWFEQLALYKPYIGRAFHSPPFRTKFICIHSVGRRCLISFTHNATSIKSYQWSRRKIKLELTVARAHRSSVKSCLSITQKYLKR